MKEYDRNRFIVAKVYNKSCWIVLWLIYCSLDVHFFIDLLFDLINIWPVLELTTKLYDGQCSLSTIAMTSSITHYLTFWNIPKNQSSLLQPRVRFCVHKSSMTSITLMFLYQHFSLLEPMYFWWRSVQVYRVNKRSFSFPPRVQLYDFLIPDSFSNHRFIAHSTGFQNGTKLSVIG